MDEIREITTHTVKTGTTAKTLAMAHMLEAAYMAGFEPSSDSLPAEELYNEALAYLTDLSK